MRHTLIAFIVVIQLCAAALAFQAPASGLQDRAASFFNALTQALSRRDRGAVADMIRFPATAPTSSAKPWNASAVKIPRSASLPTRRRAKR